MYADYTGALSASALNSNVATPAGAALDALRAAKSIEADPANQELIADTISAFKTALRGINALTGEPAMAGIKPVAGSTVPYIDIASLSVTQSDLQAGADPLVQDVWATSTVAWNACTDQDVLNNLAVACIGMQAALSGWIGALHQPGSAGADSGGAGGKGTHP